MQHYSVDAERVKEIKLLSATVILHPYLDALAGLLLFYHVPLLCG